MYGQFQDQVQVMEDSQFLIGLNGAIILIQECQINSTSHGSKSAFMIVINFPIFKTKRCKSSKCEKIIFLENDDNLLNINRKRLIIKKKIKIRVKNKITKIENNKTYKYKKITKKMRTFYSHSKINCPSLCNTSTR